ncbi:MAG: dienelactone hydrolase family protein, partial [Candidatus Eremiobacteraeota bacterium]|nr:dienelactone hydrolase family protein [Candidatus Eremiobacteraeota bacterium]
MGATIEFDRPDGKSAPGYFAAAPQDGAPGVVLIEEWWGVDERIKATADRLASHGFNVLVP